MATCNQESSASKLGDEIPEEYLEKDGFPEAIDFPDMWRDSLLLDLSLLSSSTPTSEAELVKLRSALSEWGCFQVKNHGIESSFLEELIEVSKQFFTLASEEKLKYTAADDIFQGYGSDNYARDGKSNWNYRLTLTIYPEGKRKLQLWPQKPEKFRGTIDEYSKKLVTMTEAIYKAMARSLNLEQDCFLNHQGTQGSIAGRFGYYPRCPCPERVLGVKPHTDGSTMTIVLVDNEVEGLQIQKDDQWYKAPVTPGVLFVNLGDIGEVMTNGVFKSAVHRVVTNSSTDRISVAGFCTPESKSNIEPLGELISLHQPQMYKKFNTDEYWKMFFENYSYGEVRKTLDAFKL